MDVPALVSTGPSTQLPQNAGVIGQTGTEILYGDGEILDSSRDGGLYEMPEIESSSFLLKITFDTTGSSP